MAFSRYTGTSNLLNPPRNRENTASMIDRKAVVKPAAGRPRAALGNISNKTAVPAKAESTKNLKAKPDVVKGQRAVKTGSLRNVQASSQVKSENDDKKAVIEAADVKPVDNHPRNDATDHMVISPGSAIMDLSTNSQGEEAYSKQMLKENVKDIDKDDHDNPQLVSEYVNEIYSYLRQLETRYPIRSQHLVIQAEINGRMRGILIDWLVQVHLRFHLLQETLYLTVAIIDRYLQLENVVKARLQLVGVASMWIASKYEEMYAPEVADFVYITDNAYTKSEIRQMECQILKVLDFELGRPLPLHFLRRNSKAGEVDANTHTLAKYLMELTIVEYDLVHLNPSEIAAASLCLAMKLICDTPEWTPTLVHYSCYTEKHLTWLMCRLCQLILRAGTGKLTAVKTKFQGSKFMRISKLPELDSQLVHDMSERNVSTSQ